MTYFGYIETYLPTEGDYIWEVARIESNASLKIYKAIQTNSMDREGCVMIGGSKDFMNWRDLYNTSPIIKFNGVEEDTMILLTAMKYVKREPVYYLGVLNAAVDIYIRYGETDIVSRFQDWNITRTWNDQQCLDKIRERIITKKTL